MDEIPGRKVEPVGDGIGIGSIEAEREQDIDGALMFLF